MNPKSSSCLISSSVQSLQEDNSKTLAFKELEIDRDDADRDASQDSAAEEISSTNSEGTQPPNQRRFTKMLWIGLGLAGLGAIAYFARTHLLMSRGQPAGPQFGPLSVSTVQPKVTTIQDSGDFLATLESRESVMVRPQADGRISQFFVRTGDRIKAGAPLLRLDAEIQKAQVAGSQANIDVVNADIVAAQADVESAQQSLVALDASLVSRQADLTFKQQEFTRFKNLQNKGAASLQALQEKQADLNQAKAALAEMQAQIRTQEAAIARAKADVVRQKQRKDAAIAAANQDQVQLRYYTVTAPIDGIIGDIPAKVGDLVNQSSSLLSITQNQNLDVNIEVPQEQVEQLQVGMPVQLLDNSESILKTGSISSIAPDVSAQTQSVQVQARFSNSNGQLRTNQILKARIISDKRSGVLVPMTAISRLAGKNFVFISQQYSDSPCAHESANSQPSDMEPNQWVAVQRPVELGPIIENSQDISQGLHASDRIITSGLLQLQHCMPIQLNP